MDPSDLDADPLRQLAAWMNAARDAGAPFPESMTLATASHDGAPSARMMILRGLDDGLLFFTDRDSDKGADLAANARAAALFHWLVPVQRQIRVTGPVTDATKTESDHYWQTRPPGSRRSAVAFVQSRIVANRKQLESAVAEVAAHFPEEEVIDRPDRWLGFRIVPEIVEFWEEGADRVHDRARYRRSGDGWTMEHLSP